MKPFYGLLLGFLVLAAALATGGAATATVSESAVYYAIDPNYGTLVVSGDPETQFVAYGEQPNGVYAAVGSGVIGQSGSSSFQVPHVGPTNNGQPQYKVSLWRPNGSTTILFGMLPGWEPGDDWWWLD